MTPRPIWTILSVPITALLARVLLTLPFWLAGINKALNFAGTTASFEQMGFSPPVLVVVATIAVELIGSALVIANRFAWLGAGALGVFTALTVVLVHDFWTMAPGPERMTQFNIALGHVGLIGGLILAAVLSVQPRRVSRYA
jgi:transmembrane protein